MLADDEYAISVAKTEFREAYNTSNVERLLSVFADSFTNMSEGQPSFYGTEGKEALRQEASKLFAQFHVKIEVIIIAITILGDVAYDRGWQKLRLTRKAGGEVESRNYRYCEIWQKQDDGQWKIIFFISNKDYEPQMLQAQTAE